jgi:hypothetical protein
MIQDPETNWQFVSPTPTSTILTEKYKKKKGKKLSNIRFPLFVACASNEVLTVGETRKVPGTCIRMADFRILVLDNWAMYCCLEMRDMSLSLGFGFSGGSRSINLAA